MKTKILKVFLLGIMVMGLIGIAPISSEALDVDDLNVTGKVVLGETTDAGLTGVIYKGANRWMHDYYNAVVVGGTLLGRNVFIGENAGNFTMGSGATKKWEASANVAIGYYPLYLNTTGFSNVALGEKVLYSNTTGDNNVALGTVSLLQNTTGRANMALGADALYSNTTGSNGVAVGATSLYRNTEGDYNIGIGEYSLGQILTTDHNIGIGLNAGRRLKTGGTTKNQTGTTSIFIGRDTWANADGEANQIVIGDSAIGIGSNTVVLGNDSIETTALKGNVGIGTTNPDTSLEVVGDLTIESGGEDIDPQIIFDENGNEKARIYYEGDDAIWNQNRGLKISLDGGASDKLFLSETAFGSFGRDYRAYGAWEFGGPVRAINSTSTNIGALSYNGGASSLLLQHRNEAEGDPTEATLAGDKIGEIAWLGSTAPGGPNKGSNTAIIASYAENNASIDHIPSDLRFYTAGQPCCGAANSEKMRIKSNGNVGIGTTSPSELLHVAGNIQVDGNIGAKYQDLAEWVMTKEQLTAGMVVMIDPENNDHVLPSDTPYNTLVAGVVSETPGIILGEASDDKAMIAHTGRVKVKVDTSYGAISRGDLLVTSSVKGYAMKADTDNLKPGMLLGKALQPLSEGQQGEILVLITLQ